MFSDEQLLRNLSLWAASTKHTIVIEIREIRSSVAALPIYTRDDLFPCVSTNHFSNLLSELRNWAKIFERERVQSFQHSGGWHSLAFGSGCSRMSRCESDHSCRRRALAMEPLRRVKILEKRKSMIVRDVKRMLGCLFGLEAEWMRFQTPEKVGVKALSALFLAEVYSVGVEHLARYTHLYWLYCAAALTLANKQVR